MSISSFRRHRARSTFDHTRRIAAKDGQALLWAKDVISGAGLVLFIVAAFIAASLVAAPENPYRPAQAVTSNNP